MRPLLPLGVFVLLLVGCSGDSPVPPPPVAPKKPTGPPLLADVTSTSGITFVYRNGEDANHLSILESLGGGAALLDYDRDGLLDIFLPGGGHYDGPDKKQILGHPCKLYRNRGNFVFEDVSASTGVEAPLFYTHGAAAADYDRDGWTDLLVTGWGRLALFHNESDGNGGRKFVERATEAGLTNKLWSSSAAWGDLDGDGYPDLYVCNYTDWSWDKHPKCTYDNKTNDVCPPGEFSALPDRLYHNQGNGTFAEVAEPAGLRVPRTPEEYAQLTHLSKESLQRLKDADAPKGEKTFGKGLGVLIADFDGDSRPDVYVANDTVDNFLYLNRSKDGKILLEEVGLMTGVARDNRGGPNGSMGLAVGDFDGRGKPSLFVSNYEHEKHALYRYETAGNRTYYRYATEVTGIANLGQKYVGWGTAFLDLDHDGWLDLFLATGHAIRFPTTSTRQQKPVLLINAPNPNRSPPRRFVEGSARGGTYFAKRHNSRGVAFGDLNNDGHPDMVISNINEPVAILKGLPTPGKHWIGIELKDTDGADVVGAKVQIRAGDRTQTRFAQTGGSYASSNDLRHLFGLDTAKTIDSVTVTWSDGQQQTWKDLDVDKYHTLTRKK